LPVAAAGWIPNLGAAAAPPAGAATVAVAASLSSPTLAEGGLAENALPPAAACPPNENLDADADAGAFFAYSADGTLPGLTVPHAPHFIWPSGDSTMHVSHRHIVAAAPPFDHRPPLPPPAALAALTAEPSALAGAGVTEASPPPAAAPLGAVVAGAAPFLYSDWHLTNSCLNASAVSRSFTLSRNRYLRSTGRM
jgi:hypothetical protein